jgi:hypothetical protein
MGVAREAASRGVARERRVQNATRLVREKPPLGGERLLEVSPVHRSITT